MSSRRLLLLVLTFFVFASFGVADADLGAVQGETYMEIIDSGESRWYKATVEPGATTAREDPSDRAWDFNDSITVTFLNDSGSGNDNPPAPDELNITVYYSNESMVDSPDSSTVIRQLHSGGVPSNGTEYVINATKNLSAIAAARAGTIRIRFDATFSSGVLTNYDANSDTGTTNGGLTYDTRYSQGYLRSLLNITDFTTYKNSDYTQEETNFTRGETVYIEFLTDKSAWNNTGIEEGILSATSKGGKEFSERLNLTRTDNTYQTQWTTPVDALLNDYDVDVLLRGRRIFTGSYSTQFTSQNENLTLTDGGTHTLWNNETHTYDYINISGGTTVQVKAWNGSHGGNLTLQAKESLYIGPDSTITANGVGFRGGAGGVGEENGEDGEDRNGGPAKSRLDREGAGAGGSWENNGNGGGGAGYGGSGGTGGGGTASGDAYSDEELTSIAFGSGGGGGGGGFNPDFQGDATGGDGGRGGGTIILEADSDLTVEGSVLANGENGDDGTTSWVFGDADGHDGGGGGGGAGGTIIFNASTMSIMDTAQVQAKGGDGGDGSSSAGSLDIGGKGGGGGGGGRIRIDSSDAAIQVSPITTGGAAGIQENGGSDGSPGSSGSVLIQAGETWTELHVESRGFTSSTEAVFDLNTLQDPDINRTVNASFWIEDELQLFHDRYTPRLNNSDPVEENMYVNRGESLNFSFVAKDEWNRSFSGRTVNLDVNGSAGNTFEARNFTTDATGKATGNITVGTNWIDTYHSPAPNITESRNYTTHIHFPATTTNPDLGAYGENRSSNSSFDVDSTYYGQVKHVTPEPNYSRGDDITAYAKLLTVRNTDAPTLHNVKFNFSLLQNGIMKHNFTRETNSSGENRTSLTVPDTADGAPNYTIGAILNQLGNTFFEQDAENNFSVIGPGPDHFNRTATPSSPVLHDAAQAYTFNITWRSDEGSNITEVNFVVDDVTFTWEKDGDTDGIETFNYNGTEGTWSYTLQGLSTGVHSVEWEAVTKDNGRNTTTENYRVLPVNATVHTTFTTPHGTVTINGDQRDEGVYTTNELGRNFVYAAAEENRDVFSIMDYATGDAVFHSLAYNETSTKTWLNMTQTGVENQFLLPYTTGGSRVIEKRSDLIQRGIFGSRDFLRENSPNFAYHLSDDALIRIHLSYNASAINVTTPLTLTPGRHQLQVEKTRSENGTDFLAVQRQ